MLELEKWHELLTSGDMDKLQEEIEGLSDALKEIKSEDLNFDEEMENESDSVKIDDEVISTPEMKNDFNLFGFNFTKLNPFTKNVIGISLIVLIFALIIYGLVWIKNMNKKEKKEKKKNKNN